MSQREGVTSALSEKTKGVVNLTDVCKNHRDAIENSLRDVVMVRVDTMIEELNEREVELARMNAENRRLTRDLANKTAVIDNLRERHIKLTQEIDGLKRRVEELTVEGIPA